MKKNLIIITVCSLFLFANNMQAMDARNPTISRVYGHMLRAEDLYNTPDQKPTQLIQEIQQNVIMAQSFGAATEPQPTQEQTIVLGGLLTILKHRDKESILLKTIPEIKGLFSSGQAFPSKTTIPAKIAAYKEKSLGSKSYDQFDSTPEGLSTSTFRSSP